VVKLAVAILHRTVSASPGFDSRPMQVAVFFLSSWTLCGGCGEQRCVFEGWLEAHVTMLRWLASGTSAGYLRTSSGLLDVVDII
jgi:hypothetical protein